MRAAKIAFVDVAPGISVIATAMVAAFAWLTAMEATGNPEMGLTGLFVAFLLTPAVEFVR